MPKYDYKCGECGHIQEVTHSIKEDPSVACTKCDSEHTKRYIGNANMRVIFKGTGFAINDMALDKAGVPSSVRRNIGKGDM